VESLCTSDRAKTVFRGLWRQARIFSEEKLQQRCFWQWTSYVSAKKLDRVRKEKRQILLALQHYRSSLLRICWHHWRSLKKINRAKAVMIHTRFSGFSRIQRSWKAWKLAIERSKRMEAYLSAMAAPQGRRIILKYYWRQWLDYLQESKLDKEARYRSAATWSKVQQWLKSDKA
jgi:hypothetical protein